MDECAARNRKVLLELAAAQHTMDLLGMYNMLDEPTVRHLPALCSFEKQVASNHEEPYS